MLLFGLAGCADLEVTNPNAPDAQRALATAGDVESLVSGSYGSWWLQSMHINGPPILANQSFMWSAWPANFGMVFYSSFPRIPVENQPTAQFYGNLLDYAWSRNYRALSAVAQGLTAIDNAETGIAEELGDARVQRARAFSKFVQGLATGSLALLYDEVFLIDETTDLTQEQVAVSYNDAMTAALGYFDEAITAATGMTLPIPDSWMSQEIAPGDFVELIHSFKARYRANVARTPAERAAVNWQAVIDDVNAGYAGDGGIGSSFDMITGYFVSGFFNHYVAAYMSQPNIGWAQASYMIFGMAEQDGQYQEWLALEPANRHPNLASGPFIINTPDLRFPQGADEAAQVAAPGIAHRETGDPHLMIGHKDWRLPDRGTYRWSYYRSTHMDFHRTTSPNTATPEITRAEMNLLKAEGYIRMGGAANLAQAATLINYTRTEAGLNATDAAGTNTDCVPRLPDNSCGGLMEMMKWEKRLETMVWGVHSVSWYYDGRGWGDLYAGTQLALPVPCLDRELLQQECNTLGGVGQPGGAPVSSYAYPHEG